jgi:hypothetical protein
MDEARLSIGRIAYLHATIHIVLSTSHLLFLILHYLAEWAFEILLAQNFARVQVLGFHDIAATTPRPANDLN